MLFTLDPSPPPAGLALFEHSLARKKLEQLQRSDEWRIITDVAEACFRESPTEAPWAWAAKKVWLDSKMTAEEGWYDPDKTPWAKEIQEAPLNPLIREVVVKKSSRSGITEAAFNILRWMPGQWPGNAGVVFPEDKQGRDVAKRRIVESIKRIAGGQLSDDPNDIGLSALSLLNMTIKMGPSGASRMFTEWWVRYFILDELEEHAATDTTTTYDRALSRQTDVADSLLIAISKPKRAGGPIDTYFIRGSQKLWHVPCPRCERAFVYHRSQFQNDSDCRNADGTWNLQLVEKNTFCVCPHCSQRIYEKEKRAMNDAALWVPTDAQHRRRGLDGKPVPAVPGVESYQISDYPSYHPKVTWGKLRVLALEAFEIQPTPKAKTHYINNHDGEADEPEIISTDEKTVKALEAGRIETRKVKMPDGSEVEQTQVHGIPGGYRLAKKRGQFNARLPYRPDRLLILIDKQLTHLKFAVFALRVDAALPGQCEAHLVDLGRADDETQVLHQVILQPYSVEGENEPCFITAGFIDSRHRGQEVYEFCLDCHYHHRLDIWPVRGEGKKVKKGYGDDERSADGGRSARVMRYVKDFCQRGELMVRYFKDHTLQTLLNDKITARSGWRLWLPLDYPPEFAAELIAEKYDQTADEWVHNKQKYGPNDWRDCTKYLCLWMLEFLNALLIEKGLTPSTPPVDVDPAAVETPVMAAAVATASRDYILKRRTSPEKSEAPSKEP